MKTQVLLIFHSPFQYILMLWTWSQERDWSISKTCVIISHYSTNIMKLLVILFIINCQNQYILKCYKALPGLLNFKKGMAILILALAKYLLDIVSPGGSTMFRAWWKKLGFGVPRWPENAFPSLVPWTYQNCPGKVRNWGKVLELFHHQQIFKISLCCIVMDLLNWNIFSSCFTFVEFTQCIL